jgi:hypothetical protein
MLVGEYLEFEFAPGWRGWSKDKVRLLESSGDYRAGDEAIVSMMHRFAPDPPINKLYGLHSYFLPDLSEDAIRAGEEPDLEIHASHGSWAQSRPLYHVWKTFKFGYALSKKMQRTSKTKNILIVDPDLGFVFWLGQLLYSSGSHQVLPAKSVTDAKVLIARLNVEVDLLVIGHTLEDSEHLVDNLRRSRNELPVIYLFGESEELPSSTGADAYFRKLSRFDSASEGIWLEMVRDIFSREAQKLREL